MAGRPSDLRRRVIGWRTAEARERMLRAREGPMAPDAALEAAIELHGLLTPDMDRLDTTRAREVEVVRATWRKLRTRFACPPVDVTP